MFRYERNKNLSSLHQHTPTNSMSIKNKRKNMRRIRKYLYVMKI